jgi:hypothetical protein
MALLWPRSMIPYVPVEPELVGFATSGGAPVGDLREQLVSTNIGWWEMGGSFRIVRGTDLAREWSAFRANLLGRAGTILFPVFACLYRKVYTKVPYSDGAVHSDGSSFRQGAIAAKLKGAFALNSREIRIEVGYGDIRAGDWFSIGGELYCLAQAERRATWYDCRISPWFRSTHADGAELNFVDPVCEVSVIDPKAMVPSYEDTRVATFALRFREV